MSQAPLLKIENLAVSFTAEEGRLRAVEDVSITVNRGETLGLVGESGCGKSVTALSIMRLLPKPSGRIEAGRIQFDGTDITGLAANAMHKIRGRRIAMIFQEPMTALNPVHTIGKQLCEVFRLHPQALDNGAGRKDMARKAEDMLRRVGIPDPKHRMKAFPHQISGGMRQRVMIAMALACRPALLIADEPTTALDVTIQAQILKLIKTAQQETGMAVIFITHDLGVIAETCEQVCVMYAGKVVETADVRTLFKKPAHPYTKGLLSSIPRLENERKTRLSIIPGMVPALGEFPKGCRFQNRCGRMQDICKDQDPALVQVGDAHLASCHFPVRQVAT